MNRTAAILMFIIAYTSCLVIPDDSTSNYWNAKAEETNIDTTISIVSLSIVAAFFGIPIVLLLLVALCCILPEKFSKKKKSEECSLENKKKSEECSLEC